MILKERNLSVDLAKTFAILCVIMTHVIEATYPMQVEDYGFIPSWLVAGMPLYSVGRLGVPIFMFLTGYLLLDREYTPEKAVGFWKSNLLRLLITTELWILLYFFFTAYYYHQPLDFFKLLEEVLFFKRPDINHLWYMGQILGIYLFLPIVSCVLRNLNRQTIVLIFSVSFVFAFLPSTVNPLLAIIMRNPLYSQVNVSFSGGIYGLMVIAGRGIKRGFFDGVKSWLAAAVGAASFACVLGIQYLSCKHWITYNVWYDYAFLVIASFCVLLLILRCRPSVCKRLIVWLGYSSFGVYLIHKGLLLVFYRWRLTFLPELPHMIEIPLLFALTLITSELCVYLLSRKKEAKRLLFFMK